MSIIADDHGTDQAITLWAGEYAQSLRAFIRSAPHSVEYAAFCVARQLPAAEWTTKVLWAEHNCLEFAAVWLRDQPIWPKWVASIKLATLLGGEAVIEVAGIVHGGHDGPTAQVAGLMNVMVLPEYGRAGDEGKSAADWSQVGCHDIGEVTLSWSGLPDSGDTDAATAREFARVLTAAADQLDEVVRHGRAGA